MNKRFPVLRQKLTKLLPQSLLGETTIHFQYI